MPAIPALIARSLVIALSVKLYWGISKLNIQTPCNPDCRGGEYSGEIITDRSMIFDLRVAKWEIRTEMAVLSAFWKIAKYAIASPF